MPAHRKKHRCAWGKKSYFRAGGRSSLMVMPRPLSGCQIKAKIKDFLLRYRLLLYQQWFFQNLVVSRILEMTAAPCNGLMSQSSIPAPPNTSDRQSISTKYGPTLYFRALPKTRLDCKLQSKQQCMSCSLYNYTSESPHTYYIVHRQQMSYGVNQSS